MAGGGIRVKLDCWPETLWWQWSPACAGFLQRLCEKPIWEGVWFCLDPMDSVCLRTASVERNVPRKYGPHGENSSSFSLRKSLSSQRAAGDQLNM